MGIEGEELSAAEAIGAAWDAEESVLEEALNEQPELETGEILQPAEGHDSDGDGVGEGRDDPGLRDAGAADAEPIPDGKEIDTVAVQGEADEKPPVGLSAAARESWKDTPKPMREEIARREKDFAQGIQRYAESAKRAEQMDQSLRPYHQLFAVNGGPAEFLPNLLQTASALQMGAPRQKADTVANLIHQFGIDINMLDGILTGKIPSQGETIEHAPNVNDLIDARFQKMEERQSAQRQSVVDANVTTEIAAFSADVKNEFYNDVKMDMADIFQMATNRGQEITLKQAYDKACQLNPEVSKVMASRVGQTLVNKKRKVASSVQGTLGGETGTGAPDSARAAIEMAWDAQGQI